MSSEKIKLLLCIQKKNLKQNVFIASEEEQKNMKEREKTLSH